jgi:hypothetical protein
LSPYTKREREKKIKYKKLKIILRKPKICISEKSILECPENNQRLVEEDKKKYKD